MLSKYISTSAAIMALTSLATAAPVVELSIPAQLQLADTAVDKYAILPKDEDFVFDFKNASFPMANRKTFPALVGTNLALALAEVKPCTMASLHLHPRSAEIFAVLSGHILTEMIPEGGVLEADGKTPRVIRTDLRANQTTIFPQGSFHAQVNPECEPAWAVVAFSSDDPGAALIVPQVLELTDDFALASFGGAVSVEELKKFREAVPKGAFFEVGECKKRCGL